MAHAMPFTAQDLDVLARTIYGEARSEPWSGLLAVGWVVRHRAEHPSWWGHDIASCCQQPWQFSAWNPSDPNRARLLAVTIEEPAFRLCVAAAAAVLCGLAEDGVDGATHYHTTRLPLPRWAEGKTPVITIGAHRFYKDIA